ncbi:RskA family anti-sigma factor [Pseudarthrobacter sp. N5]|uniref:RskA family anti-sigma factor n=1 Tax=Pseudarthrobacter sp. N5 TaxID=3418416 RepID=UPI003CF219C1
MTDADRPDALSEDIIQDLACGRLLDLAELYAVGALGSQGESAVDQFLRSARASLRGQFSLRVLQTREALMLTYGSLDAEPPPDLLREILAKLPTPHPAP